MKITIQNLNLTVSPEAAQIIEPLIIERAAAPTIITTPRIGERWPDEQGGVYAGVMRGHDGAPDYHLIVVDGEATLAWGAAGTTEPGAASEWDGLVNTQALVASEHEHPAAEWAVRQGPDCYLPSRRELRLCWVNVSDLFDASTWYWSSTQYSPSNAWYQPFDDGTLDYYGKAYEARVRAVRRVPVDQGKGQA